MITKQQIGALAFGAAVLASAPALASNRSGGELRQERVGYADLDLNSDAGANAMMKRISGAARRVCHSYDPTSSRAAEERRCRKTAVAEAVATLGSPTVTALHSGAQRPVQLAAR